MTQTPTIVVAHFTGPIAGKHNPAELVTQKMRETAPHSFELILFPLPGSSNYAASELPQTQLVDLAEVVPQVVGYGAKTIVFGTDQDATETVADSHALPFLQKKPQDLQYWLVPEDDRLEYRATLPLEAMAAASCAAGCPMRLRDTTQEKYLPNMVNAFTFMLQEAAHGTDVQVGSVQTPWLADDEAAEGLTLEQATAGFLAVCEMLAHAE